MHYEYKEFVSAVARRIKQLRIERGYSQRRFAFEFGYHLAQWQTIERGENLSLRTLLRVATSFEVTVQELIQGTATAVGPGVGSKGYDPGPGDKKTKPD